MDLQDKGAGGIHQMKPVFFDDIINVLCYSMRPDDHYHYQTVSALIKAAKENNIGFAADVYPFYGSDADAALKAGHDLRHGLIGPGVYASHGYERSHKDGVENTLKLLAAYIG